MSQDTCYSTNEFSGGNESGHAEEDFVACVKVVESPSHYQVSSRPLIKSGPATTSCSLPGDDAVISASIGFRSLRYVTLRADKLDRGNRVTMSGEAASQQRIQGRRTYILGCSERYTPTSLPEENIHTNPQR